MPILNVFAMKSREDLVNRLKELREEFPQLTFENVGYQYLSNKVIQEHEKPIAEINGILKKLLKGFSTFNNFKPRKDGSIVVRLQYNYGDHHETGSYFIGVGYFTFEELLNEYQK